MLFAVAMPMHMMAPISAGTERVVWVQKEEENDAGERRGKGGDDDEGIKPGLEVNHDEQVDENDGKAETGEEAEVGATHGLNLAEDAQEAAARKGLLIGGDNTVDLGG